MRVIERVWREKRLQLLAIARNVCLDGSSVDDLLQEAFAKALESEARFGDPHHAFRFLCRIVTNLAIDQNRTCVRRYQLMPFAMSSRGLPVLAPEKRGLDSVKALGGLVGAERRVLGRILMKEIKAAVKELPLRERQALRLIFCRDGRTLKEICREKGIPYSTMRSRMLRAVDSIRFRLRQKGLLDGGNGKEAR